MSHFSSTPKKSLFWQPMEATPFAVQDKTPTIGSMHFTGRKGEHVVIQLNTTQKGERVALTIESFSDGQHESTVLHLTPQVWEFLIATHERITAPPVIAPSIYG